MNPAIPTVTMSGSISLSSVMLITASTVTNELAIIRLKTRKAFHTFLQAALANKPASRDSQTAARTIKTSDIAESIRVSLSIRR